MTLNGDRGHSIGNTLLSLLSVFQLPVSARDGIVALGNVNTHPHPTFQQSPKVSFCTVSMLVLLNSDRFPPWIDSGTSTASFLHPSFLQAEMLWSALVILQKVPQVSQHLRSNKLWNGCDVRSVCQSICPFVSSDTGTARTADP